MARIAWDLQTFLDRHNLTRYQLAHAMSGNTQTRLTTLYRMNDPKRIDLQVLAEVITGLRALTQSDVTPNDLLRYLDD